MNRLLVDTFQKKEKRFIPYIMSGDPTMEAAIDIALTLQEAGVDAIEWGVPFSDPLADGPVIQLAGQRSLAQGTTIMRSIEGIKEARAKGLTVPVILFTYINPIFAYGEEAIIQAMVEADIDGLLVPDLPIEESEKLRGLCNSSNISFISLVTLSSKSRMEKLCRHGQGFLYFVSSLGVTGTRTSFSGNIEKTVEEMKNYTSVPVLIGFGVSKREHVEYFNSISDGVIVGSALVKIIADKQKALCSTNKKTALGEIKEFVLELIS